jgi:endonuclease-3
MKASSKFSKVIALLQKHYGSSKTPEVTRPLEMILWENVVYLANDEGRALAFEALSRQVGLHPAKILTASPKKLEEITRMAGILATNQAKKLRRIAQIAHNEFDDNLDQILKQPLHQAKRLLQKFPSIGEPSAEKILLFSRTHPILALESNGLRVLLRLGFGSEGKNYKATYRSVQDALNGSLPADCDALIRAHQLLRRHGQELCRRSKPLCVSCPLSHICLFYRGLRGSVQA